jgi:hypothetical protein
MAMSCADGMSRIGDNTRFLSLNKSAADGHEVAACTGR